MELSENGITFLKDVEGFKNHLYRDAAGLPTIGVGHLLTKSELNWGRIVIDGVKVKLKGGEILSDAQVDALLKQDAAKAVAAVNAAVTVPLAQHQFDALVSFAFNVGIGAFETSTLLKLLNQGSMEAAAGQFLHWVMAGGRIVQGLVNRRNRERKLFREGYEINS